MKFLSQIGIANVLIIKDTIDSITGIIFLPLHDYVLLVSSNILYGKSPPVHRRMAGGPPVG